MFSFDPDRLEKLAGIDDERLAVSAVDCGCVITVEEDSWFFNELW
jgi:hypothetical protein